MKPKKSLGQNFLTSIPARNAIVAAGEIDKDDVILEIGPGKGMLTEALLESAHTVIALEKDRELIPYLEEKFKSFIQSKKLILIQGDVLTYTPETIRYKIIANIPYYITGAIFSKFLSEVHQPTQMVVSLMSTGCIIGRGMSSTFHRELLQWPAAAAPLPRSTSL
jgi:16S rRNA (adenine1518-N6/adenine1519-N6)-dimethyltransferase